MLAIFGRRQKQTWYNMELGMYKLGSIWDPHVAHLFNLSQLETPVTHMGDIPRFFFLFSIPFFSIYSIPFFSPICWSERLDILLRLNASLEAIATPHVVLSTMIQCNRGKFISTINEALGKPHYLYV